MARFESWNCWGLCWEIKRNKYCGARSGWCVHALSHVNWFHGLGICWLYFVSPSNTHSFTNYMHTFGLNLEVRVEYIYSLALLLLISWIFAKDIVRPSIIPYIFIIHSNIFIGNTDTIQNILTIQTGIVHYLNRVLFPPIFKVSVHESKTLFSLFSMIHLGNTKRVVLSRCRLVINMTNGITLLYHRGNTKHK